ncbi:MAG: tetratricopeptide repeat protein [Acidobacteriota bacterium]
MELLYNPNVMSEEEVKATFVARQHLLDELVSLIERQPDGAGVQHAVIIAPRGMGKTTMLLMVQFAVRDRGLSAQWQSVKFPEESYGIYDLADFWIEVIDHLATEISDEKLRDKIATIRSEYRDDDDLQEAALAVIRDWRKKHGRRLLLLVDNFDLILEQINDERDNARLREVLMNDGTMMLLGGATTFFHEARAYDQPLYNFFKIYDLERLKFEEMQELLRRRAEADGRTDFEEKLQANKARLRALEYFTGGNPRLAIMLYRVVALSDLADVKRGLEKLLDEATPFYKHKTESLPPQQRKILDCIARESSRTFEGVTPTQVAEATRMTANQASAQLKRLVELGYVQTANLRQRSTFYVLSERLYAIWYKMRFGRDARQRMEWLVDFMKSYYGAEEMRTESGRLDARFREYLSAGRMREARDTLEHRYLLTLAMPDFSDRSEAMSGVVCSYLMLGDFEKLNKEVLTLEMMAGLSKETLDAIGMAMTTKLKRTEESIAILNLTISAFEKRRFDEVLQQTDQALQINPDLHTAWFLRGQALAELGRQEEAIASYDRAIENKPDFYEALDARGVALDQLGRYQEAVASYDRALNIKPEYHAAWYNRGIALDKLEEYGEAITSYDKAFDGFPDKRKAWINLAGNYFNKFTFSLAKGEENTARQSWNAARKYSEHIGEGISGILFFLLWKAAKSGHQEFVRQLIRESDLEEPLFPLARAIDYLLTNDDALIEKLSPEVRGIVEEIVDKLGKSSRKTRPAQSTARKKKTGKKKSGPRSRVRKQLV